MEPDRTRRRFGFLGLMALLSPASLAGAEPLSRDEIAAAWKRRADAIHVEWRYDSTGVHRFQRYQLDGIPSNKDAAERRATLSIDHKRFRFETVRWTDGEHGYQAEGIKAASVDGMYPERKLAPFAAALRDKFDDPRAELRDSRKFLRTFDGRTLCDFWAPISGDYPRGTIRRGLSFGERATAAAGVRTVGDELQDLSLVGAVLAVCPLHPGVDFRLERCQIAAEPVRANGDLCIVLTESPAAEPHSRRTVWLDSTRDLSIRRIIDATSTGGHQVDIQYRHDKRLGWIPAEWTVSSFSNDGTRLDAARIIVTNFESRPALKGGEVAISYPAGTWVIDEPAGSQYILRSAGAKREIQPQEFDWLPTYDDFSSTEPGQVGSFVESKLRWNRYWLSARLPALLGIATLTSALILSLWRRGRR